MGASGPREFEPNEPRDDDVAEGPPAQGDLEAAAAVAVDSSSRELDELEQAVAQVLELLPAAVLRAEGQSVDGESASPFTKVAESVTARLSDHFTRQREVLGSFNIALFGRTGAGKSTLLSALGCLDGSRVSPGESDWTEHVEPIDWRGCRLYDTPGINGWGRKQNRSSLDATARRAVEVADVVILCFDTQSQQASEFEKVAAWVRDYGKPVIAVLNVRNDRWRNSDRTRDRAGRESLSRAVGEHADHIMEELSFIGLRAVPVVAVNSHRALAARASVPLAGPKAPSIALARERHGEEKLLDMSNFGSLEALVAAAVAAGGAQLRLVALREGVRQLLTELRKDLEELTSEASGPLAALDRTVQSILDVVGYPDEDSAQRTDATALWSEELGGDLVRIYEIARREPFTARVRGTLARYVDHLLSGELAKERAESFKRAGKLVVASFAKRQKIDQGAFADKVLDQKAIESAVNGVWREAGQFMQRELSIAIDEGKTDVENLQGQIGLDGGSGGGLRRVGLGLGITGIASSATMATLTILATANIWNPGGWIVFGVLGGLTLGSALIGYLGTKSNEKGELEKASARAQAVADARTIVADYFSRLQTDLRSQFESTASDVSAAPLRIALERAVEIHRYLESIARVQDATTDRIERMPRSPDAAEIMAAAATTLSREQGRGKDPRHLTVAAVLRGESWLLEADDDSVQQSLSAHPDRHLLVAQAAMDQESSTAAFSQMWRSLSQVEATAWLDRLAQDSTGDLELDAIVERSRSIIGGNPRIVLVGDYSSGKSSLIKRLLVESGLPIPADLTVRGQPTNTPTCEYPMRSVVLVDSPGLQSGFVDHDGSALAAVADAALVVIVVHNNLLIGDTSMLRTVLTGDGSNSPKLARALFVINRSDGLVGHDPNVDPRAFLDARWRRENELRAALGSIGASVGDGRIVTLAADPYGTVGDSPDATRDDYSLGRDWDGVESLLAAVNSSENLLLGPAVAASALDGALSRMMALRERLTLDVELLEWNSTSSERIAEALRSALRDGEHLATAIETKVFEVVSQHSQKQLRQVLESVGKALPAQTKQLEHWWKDPALQDDLDRLLTEMTSLIDAWIRDHESLLEREIRVAAAQLQDITAGSAVDAGRLGRDSKFTRAVQLTLNMGGDAANLLKEHKAFYAAGKFFKFKFKPWGAVKGAKFMAKAGPALAVVGVAVDVADFIIARRGESRREQARLKAISFVEDSAKEVAEVVCRGDDDDPGPVTVVNDTLAEIRQELAALEERLAAEREEIGVIQRRIAKITQRVSEAIDILSANKDLEVSDAAK